MGELWEAGKTKRSTSPAAALDHEALLTLARKLCAAASDGDVGHLKTATREFETALAGHLREEAATVTELDPARERMLYRGQERLWSATTQLVWNADHGCPHPSQYCSERAQELLALMTLQAHDEHRARCSYAT